MLHFSAENIGNPRANQNNGRGKALRTKCRWPRAKWGRHLMSKAILVDTTKCIGRGAYAAGCNVVIGLPLGRVDAARLLSADSVHEDELVAFAAKHALEVKGLLTAPTGVTMEVG
jgi:hypothetical protein